MSRQVVFIDYPLATQAGSGRFRSNQPGTHPHVLRGFDSYPTPPIAIEGLLDVEPELLRATVYEPAAGAGNIVKTLRKRGIRCIAGDIVKKRGFKLDHVGDFLTQERVPRGCDAIVTNPPFSSAAPMVARALQLVPRVYLLLRLAFLESERRTPILEDGTLARVYVFRSACR